ncbi:MAG: dienelactone hydrolase family protein [Myxococcaceae bacterium]
MSQLLGEDGAPLLGFLDESAGEGAPAVLVIQEWWGVNEQVKGIVRRLASEGFLAFAVDLYRGKVTKDAAEAAELMQALDSKAALVDLGAAVRALLLRSQGRLGVLGFCMGGGYALATAAHHQEVKAVVAFYGIPSAALADVSHISAKVLGHYATRDRSVTPERVDALERRLRAAGVQETLYRYEADHAFANEQRPTVYAPEAAQLAWQRTLAFFHTELGGRPAKG